MHTIASTGIPQSALTNIPDTISSKTATPFPPQTQTKPKHPHSRGEHDHCRRCTPNHPLRRHRDPRHPVRRRRTHRARTPAPAPARGTGHAAHAGRGQRRGRRPSRGYAGAGRSDARAGLSGAGGSACSGVSRLADDLQRSGKRDRKEGDLVGAEGRFCGAGAVDV